MFMTIPLKSPQPDGRSFINILMGKSRGAAVPLVEYLVDEAVLRPVLEGVLGRPWVAAAEDRASRKAYLDNFIEFWYRLGYDVVRYEAGLNFPANKILAPDTALTGKARAWADEHRGAIANWQDFETYPWPSAEAFDFSPFEYLNYRLPEGMGLVASHAGGVFEHLSWIMSFEGLCEALAEHPDLVRAVVDRVGESQLTFYRQLLDLDRLVAILAGDDMGFRGGTLIAPADLRTYCLPWLTRIAALAHAKGIPFFLHSCGDITAIMDDLIANVAIDGKHSFEDAILPVEQFQARYGGRLAALGGLDVHILAAATPEQVRRRTRQLIDRCGSAGRFAVGSGNSIPSYVEVANYLAMVDEALSARF